MSRYALALGYLDMVIGGIVFAGLLIWGGLELWWRLTEPWKLMGDLYAWKRARAAGTWPPKPQEPRP